MKALGKDLIFISRIKRDGSGVDIINEQPDWVSEDIFKLQNLSLTEKTFIATAFNSYVVKLKEPNNIPEPTFSELLDIL